MLAPCLAGSGSWAEMMLAEPGWERKGRVLERRSPPGAGRALMLGYVRMVKW